MRKRIISLLIAAILIISMTGYSYAAQNDTNQQLKSDGFYNENSLEKNTKKLSVFISDGSPLVNGYVQIYSIDQNKYVFLGKTDENGQVDFKISNDKSELVKKLKSKNVNIIDCHYIMFAGNNEEVATEGMTISYGVSDIKKVNSLLDSEILTRDTDIPNKISTTKFSDTKDFKAKDIKEVDELQPTDISSIGKGEIIQYEVPIWHLESEVFLGSRETTIAHVNICDGVQSSFDMSQSSYGTVKLSGGSVVAVTYSSGSTISCKSILADGTYSGTHREYKTNFKYYDQLWISTWGEMTKLVPKAWDGYLNKYDTYESMCTVAHLSDCYSMGYITVQGGQSSTISYSTGLTISGASKMASSFNSNTFYNVDASYTSSTYSAMTRNFTTKHSIYLVYPQTSHSYIIPQ